VQGGTPHLHALKPERLRAPVSARSFESDVVLYLVEPVLGNRAMKTASASKWSGEALPSSAQCRGRLNQSPKK